MGTTFTVVAYAIPAAFGITDDRWRWLLLPLLSAPLAIVLVRRVLGGLAGRDLNAVLERSGQLLLLFGVLLAAGLLLARPR